MFRLDILAFFLLLPLIVIVSATGKMLLYHLMEITITVQALIINTTLLTHEWGTRFNYANARRKALDSHKYVAAILMDLTKAFDCLPHSLLLGKLNAYGLSDKSCSLVSNYLSNRKQLYSWPSSFQ